MIRNWTRGLTQAVEAIAGTNDVGIGMIFGSMFAMVFLISASLLQFELKIHGDAQLRIIHFGARLPAMIVGMLAFYRGNHAYTSAFCLSWIFMEAQII